MYECGSFLKHLSLASTVFPFQETLEYKSTRYLVYFEVLSLPLLKFKQGELSLAWVDTQTDLFQIG